MFRIIPVIVSAGGTVVWLWVVGWLLLSAVALVLVVAVVRSGEQEEAMRERARPEDD